MSADGQFTVPENIHMRSRWTILAALFVARAAFAFQFESVAAVAPQLGQSLGASMADIRILIGLNFEPGALLDQAHGAARVGLYTTSEHPAV